MGDDVDALDAFGVQKIKLDCRPESISNVTILPLHSCRMKPIGNGLPFTATRHNTVQLLVLLALLTRLFELKEVDAIA